MERKGYRPGRECGLCKGKCCKEHGCVLSPDDLIRAMNKVPKREELCEFLMRKDGLFAIDSAMGEGQRFYYLRMRHKCYNFIGVDAMGECVALSEDGCTLSYEERPKGGRMLKSSPDFHCRQEYTVEEMQSDWAPFREMLAGIYEEYEKRFTEDGTFDACDEAYFQWQRDRKMLVSPKNK